MSLKLVGQGVSVNLKANAHKDDATLVGLLHAVDPDTGNIILLQVRPGVYDMLHCLLFVQ